MTIQEKILLFKENNGKSSCENILKIQEHHAPMLLL